MGDGQFNHPIDVAVDSTGHLYVTDSFNNRIQKFDSDGNFIKKWGTQGSSEGQFSVPFGIAIDSSNNVYVDDFTDRVQKFTSDGVFIREWGSQGFDDGQFRNPHGLAIDSSDNVYVADEANNLIQKFDKDGNFIKEWGTGSDVGRLNEPFGLDVDSSDNVYEADTGSDRIQKFTKDGNFTTSFGESGSANGQLKRPMGVALDSSGKVYVADTSNYRIQVFSQSVSDTVPPDTAITSSVDGNNKNIKNGSFSSSNSITFNFAGTDNEGIQGFKCKLDQNNVEDCANPKSYSNLPDRQHTFSVFAVDTSSNEDFTPAVLGWTVDTIKPVVTVPSDLNVNATGSSGAVVTFSASANDNIDGSLQVSCVPTSGSVFPIGSTKVTCTATDNAGNIGMASFSVIVKEPSKPFVEKTLLSLSIKPNRAFVTGGDFSLSGRLSDGSTGRKLVGGQEISFTVEPTGILSITTVKTDPAGRFSLSKLKAPNVDGNYKITAHFAGNQFLLPSDSNPALLKVEKKGTSLTLLVKGNLNSGASLLGSLTDVSTHKGISSQSISFVTNNQDLIVHAVVTDSKGKYNLPLNAISCGTKSIQVQSHLSLATRHHWFSEPPDVYLHIQSYLRIWKLIQIAPRQLVKYSRK